MKKMTQKELIAELMTPVLYDAMHDLENDGSNWRFAYYPNAKEITSVKKDVENNELITKVKTWGCWYDREDETRDAGWYELTIRSFRFSNGELMVHVDDIEPVGDNVVTLYARNF